MNNFEFTNVMNSQETETDETCSGSTESFQVNEASILRKDFEILDNIGKGAYAAAVYKVRNKLDVKLYAIKVIPCEKLNEEMPKEVEFLSVLNHPNVVRYCTSWTDGAKKKEYYDKDSESSDDFVKFERESSSEKSNMNAKDISPTSTDSNNHRICMFIQMEFCETTLANVIKGTVDGPLSPDGDKELHKNPDRILRLITHIVKGLAYIHDKGIIHRDLKPENILIDGDDFAKIGDFGLATWNRALTDGKASHTGKVGTPLYDAPELGVLCSGSKAHYNEKVDMYSLGIIIYEMCCPSFETAMERKEVLSDLRNNPLHIPQFELPKGLSKLIFKLLHHDTKRRPSAAEILKNGCLVFDEINIMNPNKFSIEKILPSPMASKINLLEAMKGKARNIFELHGGYLSPHAMLPSTYYEYLIENSAIHPKTYSFNEIPSKTSNMIDRQHYARFDMVFPDSIPANFAMLVEALEIAYEFLDSFSGLVNTSNFVIRLFDCEIISADATIQKAYKNLKRLINIMKSRKMKCQLLVPSKFEENIDFPEIVFQIICGNEVLASGDRYRLPAKYVSNSANQFIKQQSVIGVTIFLTRFIDILESKNIFLSKFDVFIGSVYCNQLIEEKLDLAKKLRDVGIRCTPSYTNYGNIRAIKKYVEKKKIHYAVILEKIKLERDQKVTLYSRITGNRYQEEDITMENIVPHLRKSIEQSNMAQFLSF